MGFCHPCITHDPWEKIAEGALIPTGCEVTLLGTCRDRFRQIDWGLSSLRGNAQVGGICPRKYYKPAEGRFEGRGFWDHCSKFSKGPPSSARRFDIEYQKVIIIIRIARRPIELGMVRLSVAHIWKFVACQGGNARGERDWEGNGVKWSTKRRHLYEERRTGKMRG